MNILCGEVVKRLPQRIKSFLFIKPMILIFHSPYGIPLVLYSSLNSTFKKFEASSHWILFNMLFNFLNTAFLKKMKQ
jgi:hypothetical protein